MSRAIMRRHHRQPSSAADPGQSAPQRLCLVTRRPCSSPRRLFRHRRSSKPVNYRGFLAENQRHLSTCGGWTECDVILFNLGFVYAYPQSPYRDPQKARQYLRELQQQVSTELLGFAGTGVAGLHERAGRSRRSPTATSRTGCVHAMPPSESYGDSSIVHGRSISKSKRRSASSCAEGLHGWRTNSRSGR